MTIRNRSKKAHRLDLASQPSLRNWQQLRATTAEKVKSEAVADMGWGRLIFAHTFSSNERLAEVLCEEQRGRRDIAFYIRDPHVVLSLAPHRLFLDPSHTYRLWNHQYRPAPSRSRGFQIRRLRTREDAEAVNRIYATRRMVECDPQFMEERNAGRLRTYFVAVSRATGEVVGSVTGVDHVEAFNDPENGASLWCLAVDPQCQIPGVGEGLVRNLAEHFFARGRQYLDLSVMHDNNEAIGLYEKLGFRRVPVFCIKHKNPINEPLFIPPQPEAKLNPYAQIIVDEAMRRGIVVEVVDEEAGYFRLHLGGRSVVCRESLTELTSAIAMSCCDDKQVTRRLFAKAGLKVPAQQVAGRTDDDVLFLQKHGSVVVKPARGEQGAGITVDVRTMEELEPAIAVARSVCDRVILEQFVAGDDLRVIVIDFEVVAAAVRQPPEITGTGQHTIRQLIEKYSRRRAAATGGESHVPIDDATEQCVRGAGYTLDDILPAQEVLRVRKTANLHTGGTIHDVTPQLHPRLREVSVEAARALDIPLVGLDMIVPDVADEEYVLIEANERPGLANHEPQPTAEKFIDFLFPHSIAAR
jgi:GNAT-family acetyltransferase (TIGR03103 family)